MTSTTKSRGDPMNMQTLDYETVYAAAWLRLREEEKRGRYYPPSTAPSEAALKAARAGGEKSVAVRKARAAKASLPFLAAINDGCKSTGQILERVGAGYRVITNRLRWMRDQNPPLIETTQCGRITTHEITPAGREWLAKWEGKE